MTDQYAKHTQTSNFALADIFRNYLHEKYITVVYTIIYMLTYMQYIYIYDNMVNSHEFIVTIPVATSVK